MRNLVHLKQKQCCLKAYKQSEDLGRIPGASTPHLPLAPGHQGGPVWLGKCQDREWASVALHPGAAGHSRQAPTWGQSVYPMGASWVGSRDWSSLLEHSDPRDRARVAQILCCKGPNDPLNTSNGSHFQIPGWRERVPLAATSGPYRPICHSGTLQ